ncbi:MAG: ATP-binding cassette domain-containing protein [Chloroflexi bacterium]|nr:ATP-binding cassette domain-containing protein [Chloroflexota bacterium]
MSETTLLEIKGLTKYFPFRSTFFNFRSKKYVQALDGVDLTIQRQETLGVVGESGCGKTTLGRTILQLIRPTSGQIIFEGVDITALSRRELRNHRRHMQMVFQNPYSSFDPRATVLQSLAEPLRTHTKLRDKALIRRAQELLEQTGMPGDILFRYPHEFSGGQLQRIAVARALALNPKFIVLDEPTSALDVSVQAQIINLLQILQRDLKLTYLFITHDLSVVQHISDRIAVMYLGKVVELSQTDTIFTGGVQHPYTRALLSSAPILDPELRKERIVLSGNVPDSANPPSGCRFHPRCPIAQEICSQIEPELKTTGDGHWVACHLAEMNHKEDI